MKKLILSACAAAACWTSDAGAMDVKTEEDGRVVKCESKDDQFMMISRWELGNTYCSSRCECLYVDYKDTEEKFNREKSKADITREMENMLYTLPTYIGDFSNLKVLCVHGSIPDLVSSYSDGIYLRVLPDSIGNLTNLRILDLSDNHLKTLPDSIGNLKNLEELRLSSNYEFSKLPESVGNLENLRILNLERTDLNTLPESMENLTNLEDLSLSRSVKKEGPHKYGVDRSTERVYGSEDYPPNWYRNIIDQSLKHWSCPPLVPDNGKRNLEKSTLSLNLSGKNLKQIPFGIYMMKERHNTNWIDGPTEGYVTPELKELDVSNNRITKISHLLKKLTNLKKLYLHINPNLNHLPDFLWEMRSLEELKIDGKLIKDLPENAEYSLDNENLEDMVLNLAIDGKNNKKMSDEELSRRTGPYIVHLKKN